MTIRRSHVILGTAAVAAVLSVAVARTRAVQEWYRTVDVRGKMTAYLLDDRAAVTGLLLDGGQQIRTGPRLGSAIASRVKKGDLVSVVGRGGRATSFGQSIDGHAITINGQTVTLASEPEGPDGGPSGPGRRGRANRPGVALDRGAGPPAPDGRGHMPEPLAQPASGEFETVHGTVNTFLVGTGGEVRGLILNTGEQVRFSPRVGEIVGAQKSAPHPEVTVVGEIVRSEYGIIVRAAQLTVGSHTILVR